MMRFTSGAEMGAFLGKLDPDYAQYAPALRQKGIKTPRQLANFSEPHYRLCGVLEGHIDDIKASSHPAQHQSTDPAFQHDSFQMGHSSVSQQPLLCQLPTPQGSHSAAQLSPYAHHQQQLYTSMMPAQALGHTQGMAATASQEPAQPLPQQWMATPQLTTPGCSAT